MVASLAAAARLEARDLGSLLARLAEAIRGDVRMRTRIEIGRARIRTSARIAVGITAATLVFLYVFARHQLISSRKSQTVNVAPQRRRPDPRRLALMTSAWTREHLDILDDTAARTRVLHPSETAPVIDGLYLWDLWPIRSADGSIPSFDGTEFWMALSVPRQLAPSARHGVARIRLLSKIGPDWSDRGPVFPDGATPGSREWAGSAVFDAETGRVSVRYTATGYRHEPSPTFAQRIFEATSTFDPGAAVAFPEWSDHYELVDQGGPYRSSLDQTGTLGSSMTRSPGARVCCSRLRWPIPAPTSTLRWAWRPGANRPTRGSEESLSSMPMASTTRWSGPTPFTTAVCTTSSSRPKLVLSILQ